MQKIDEIAIKLANGKTLEQLREEQANFENRRQGQGMTAEQKAKAEMYLSKVTAETPKVQTSFTSLSYDDTRKILAAELDKRGFKVNDNNRHIIQSLCAWLSGNSLTNEKGEIILDAKKGIFLCGGTGNGKTTLVKTLQNIAFNTPQYRFRFFKMRYVSDMLGQMAKGDIPTAEDFKCNWCFDEVGADYLKVEKVFSNSFHPLPFLIDLIYNNYKSGYTYLMTSNLAMREILYENASEPSDKWRFRNGFDERTRRRLAEMFNYIVNTDVDHTFKK